MLKQITAIVARYGLLGGDKLYQIRARQTLPLLVRQAKAGQTVYYSDLATELGYPNPRSFNYILGAIGNALIDLSKSTDQEIPPIQCIVINKSYQLPGDGIGWFINQNDFNKLPKAQQKLIIDSELSKIYTYNKWDWVLNELGLEPIKTELHDDLQQAKIFRGGGESDKHKRFKEWIAKNPSALQLKSSLDDGNLEYRLASGDSIDVLFLDKSLNIGV